MTARCFLHREPGVAAMTIRKAKIGDAPKIQALIAPFAARDEMLPRNLNEVYENLRDYLVCEDDGALLGCCALHVNTEELAEVKALAVHPDAQGRGVGGQLVGACVDEARNIGIPRVFCLTYRPGFFEKLGFRLVEKATLPHKVWNECIFCPKFPVCGEEAMVLDVTAVAVPAG